MIIYTTHTSNSRLGEDRFFWVMGTSWKGMVYYNCFECYTDSLLGANAPRQKPLCGIGSFHLREKGGGIPGIPKNLFIFHIHFYSLWSGKCMKMLISHQLWGWCLRQDLTKALVNLHMPSYSRGPKVVERILGQLHQGRWFDVVWVDVGSRHIFWYLLISFIFLSCMTMTHAASQVQ